MSSSLGSCGCAAPPISFRKLSLSCVPVVKPSRIVLAWTRENYRQIDARKECHSQSIGSTFFPHCIALAPMQLVDMQQHNSGIILMLVLRGLLSPGSKTSGSMSYPWGEKPPTTNQSIIIVAAVGTVHFACLIQGIRVLLLPQRTSIFWRGRSRWPLPIFYPRRGRPVFSCAISRSAAVHDAPKMAFSLLIKYQS